MVWQRECLHFAKGGAGRNWGKAVAFHLPPAAAACNTRRCSGASPPRLSARLPRKGWLLQPSQSRAPCPLICKEATAERRRDARSRLSSQSPGEQCCRSGTARVKGTGSPKLLLGPTYWRQLGGRSGTGTAACGGGGLIMIHGAFCSKRSLKPTFASHRRERGGEGKKAPGGGGGVRVKTASS